MKKFNESDYIYKANNNKLLNESSFTIEEFCYDNDIEDPKTFIRILRQLCDFDDIEQADNSLLRKALVKYQQTLKESSDYIYTAKIGDKLYLQGNSQDGWDTTSDPDEAAIFESKTEPTQIINQMKKDGKISKNDKITVLSESISDFKGHLLLGTAVLGIGTLTAIDHNKAKLTADKLGIELAETEYGPHKAAGLVGPIYEYKYGMKGPMNIDSLCEYLKNHTDYDEITYEDEGDNYVINYTDNYAIHQTAANATVTKHRTSKGNLNLPKEYFDVSFVLDESKTALFDCLLKETKFSKETIMILKALNALGGKAKPSTIYEKAFGLPRFGREAELDFKQLKSEGLIDYNKNTIQYELTNKGINFLNLSNNLKESEKLFKNALNESNVAIAPWRRETAERLIEEANKIDPSYSFVEYDIGPKKEIKYKIFKNDDEYVGTFDVFTDDPYNSPYRYFFHHVNVGGLEFQGMTIDEFNKDFNEFIELDERVGHKALNEARVFSHSSGFGLSGHYNDYEVPKDDPLYIATETNEDDGELYFDEKGNTTEFETDAKKFTSEEDALEFAKNNVIFGEPGTKLYEKFEKTLYKEKNTMKNKKFKFIIEYNTGDYEWDNYPLVDDFNGTWEELEDYLKTTFDSEDRERLLKGDYIILDDDGDSRIYIKETVNLSKENKLFENSDNLFNYVLNESSLKENISSLEWLLDKAYVSEYRMVGKNSAEVRVRHTPELLTSESMAARFDEDIPDGYRLEVDYLGEDPILGRNFDIYEVQLVKD